MNWVKRHQNWINRHRNWAVLLWIILAPTMVIAIFLIPYVIFYYTVPSLIMPIITGMILTSVASVVVVLTYFYQKSKQKKRSK
jgi:uncharacterized membrane protein